MAARLSYVCHYVSAVQFNGCLNMWYFITILWVKDIRTCMIPKATHTIGSKHTLSYINRGVRWLSGRVSDSGARGRGFETYRRRVVSLSKTLYSPKVLVNYPGSGGSVPIWLKNCWLGRWASTQTKKLHKQYDTFWDKISFKSNLVKSNIYLRYTVIM